MMNALALCAVGAEKALSNELRKLDLQVESSGFGRARFRADAEGLYRALMGLRTADRVLLEADSFPARDFDELFEGVRAVRWEDIVPRGRTITVGKVRTNRSRLSAETAVQAVVHKAAAERLCTRWGVSRLDDGAVPVELRVYLERDVASVLVDLCGEPLFRRGYRTEGGAAPLRESTAAAVLLLSGWKRKHPLHDPFCGSGTFAVEASLYAWDAAPGLGRTFALPGLAITDPAAERRVREAFLARVDFTRTVRVSGSDSDPRAVSIAASNAARAYELARGLVPGRGIRLDGAGAPEGVLPAFELARMEDARARDAEPGFLVANPPYGERLGDKAESERTYRAMRALEDGFPGWSLTVITDHPGFESHFCRAADSVREITNGALRSYVYAYRALGERKDVDSRRA